MLFSLFCFFSLNFQSHEHIDPAFLFLLIFCSCYSFFMVFLVCEIGQRISNSFEKIWSKIDRFNWYLYPHDLKRALFIIMIFAQQPFDVDIFGSFACCRFSFKKVRSSCLIIILVDISNGSFRCKFKLFCWILLKCALVNCFFSLFVLGIE